MNKESIYREALHFRMAIEKARDEGEFRKVEYGRIDRMDRFPRGCCDDAADLFTHYLYHKYGIDSIRVDARYNDIIYNCHSGHSWQIFENWIVDLTGDQFDYDPSLPVKVGAIYVGNLGDFHKQFEIESQYHSRGIECLGTGCHVRMYSLYDIIMKYME